MVGRNGVPPRARNYGFGLVKSITLSDKGTKPWLFLFLWFLIVISADADFEFLSNRTIYTAGTRTVEGTVIDQGRHQQEQLPDERELQLRQKRNRTKSSSSSLPSSYYRVNIGNYILESSMVVPIACGKEMAVTIKNAAQTILHRYANRHRDCRHLLQPAMQTVLGDPVCIEDTQKIRIAGGYMDFASNTNEPPVVADDSIEEQNAVFAEGVSESDVLLCLKLAMSSDDLLTAVQQAYAWVADLDYSGDPILSSEPSFSVAPSDIPSLMPSSYTSIADSEIDETGDGEDGENVGTDTPVFSSEEGEEKSQSDDVREGNNNDGINSTVVALAFGVPIAIIFLTLVARKTFRRTGNNSNPGPSDSMQVLPASKEIMVWTSNPYSDQDCDDSGFMEEGRESTRREIYQSNIHDGGRSVVSNASTAFETVLMDSPPRPTATVRSIPVVDAETIPTIKSTQRSGVSSSSFNAQGVGTGPILFWKMKKIKKKKLSESSELSNKTSGSSAVPTTDEEMEDVPLGSSPLSPPRLVGRNLNYSGNEQGDILRDWDDDLSLSPTSRPLVTRSSILAVDKFPTEIDTRTLRTANQNTGNNKHAVDAIIRDEEGNHASGTEDSSRPDDDFLLSNYLKSDYTEETVLSEPPSPPSQVRVSKQVRFFFEDEHRGDRHDETRKEAENTSQSSSLANTPRGPAFSVISTGGSVDVKEETYSAPSSGEYLIPADSAVLPSLHETDKNDRNNIDSIQRMSSAGCQNKGRESHLGCIIEQSKCHTREKDNASNNTSTIPNSPCNNKSSSLSLKYFSSTTIATGSLSEIRSPEAAIPIPNFPEMAVESAHDLYQDTTLPAPNGSPNHSNDVGGYISGTVVDEGPDMDSDRDDKSGNRGTEAHDNDKSNSESGNIDSASSTPLDIGYLFSTSLHRTFHEKVTSDSLSSDGRKLIETEANEFVSSHYHLSEQSSQLALVNKVVDSPGSRSKPKTVEEVTNVVDSSGSRSKPKTVEEENLSQYDSGSNTTTKSDSEKGSNTGTGTDIRLSPTDIAFSPLGKKPSVTIATGCFSKQTEFAPANRLTCSAEKVQASIMPKSKSCPAPCHGENKSYEKGCNHVGVKSISSQENARNTEKNGDEHQIGESKVGNTGASSRGSDAETTKNECLSLSDKATEPFAASTSVSTTNVTPPEKERNEACKYLSKITGKPSSSHSTESDEAILTMDEKNGAVYLSTKSPRDAKTTAMTGLSDDDESEQKCHPQNTSSLAKGSILYFGEYDCSMSPPNLPILEQPQPSAVIVRGTFESSGKEEDTITSDGSLSPHEQGKNIVPRMTSDNMYNREQRESPHKEMRITSTPPVLDIANEREHTGALHQTHPLTSPETTWLPSQEYDCASNLTDEANAASDTLETELTRPSVNSTLLVTGSFFRVHPIDRGNSQNAEESQSHHGTASSPAFTTDDNNNDDSDQEWFFGKIW